jgi:hypothetical protein
MQYPVELEIQWFGKGIIEIKVQWTAMGEGCTDLKTFTSEWQRLCPKLPMQLETISGVAKEFPFLDENF